MTDSTRRGILHGSWIVAAGVMLAQPTAASAATTEDQTYVVPLPPVIDADHTQHLQQHMQTAGQQLAKRVIIPNIDPSDPTARWIISASLPVWSGVELLIAPIKSTSSSEPIVQVPATAVGTQIYFQDAEGTRLSSYAAYPQGAANQSKRLSHAAVVVFGSRTIVRGYIHGFRIGAVAGNYVASVGQNSGRPVGVDIEIEVHDVDFGIFYYAQKSGRFVARGNHVRTPNSPDEPHLIYGAQAPTSSQDCTVAVDCWAPIDADGAYIDMEGGPLILKSNDNVYVPWVICRRTSGMLEIVNEFGPTKVGTMIGDEIGTESKDKDGLPKLSGVLLCYISSTPENPWTEPPHSKSVDSLTVKLRDDPASDVKRLRVVTLNSGSWSIGSLDIEYRYDQTIVDEPLIAVQGGDTDIDRLRITNRGTGGVVGLRYRAGTEGPHGRHYLRAAPNIRGASTAIVIDDDIVDVSLNVDRTRMADVVTVLSAKRRLGRVFTQNSVAASTRVNRYYAFPPASSVQSVSLGANIEYCYPILITEPCKVGAMGVRVTTGAADATVRLVVRNDYGNGMPGAKVTHSGPLDASSAGDREATLDSTVSLSPGTYWLGIVAQGAAIQVRGSSAAAVLGPSATLAAALTGAVVFQNNVTGDPPEGFAEAGQSTASGCARIAVKFV
jgi:hypothetical protein